MIDGEGFETGVFPDLDSSAPICPFFVLIGAFPHLSGFCRFFLGFSRFVLSSFRPIKRIRKTRNTPERVRHTIRTFSPQRKLESPRLRDHPVYLPSNLGDDIDIKEAMTVLSALGETDHELGKLLFATLDKVRIPKEGTTTPNLSAPSDAMSLRLRLRFSDAVERVAATFRNWPCLSSCSFRAGVLSFSLLFPPSFLVRLRLGSGFYTGHGWFLPFGGHVIFLLLWCCFSLSICVQPRLAKICLVFLRPALCAWFFLRSRSGLLLLRGFGGVLGLGWLDARCSPLSSLAVCFFLFFVFWARPMQRPDFGDNTLPCCYSANWLYWLWDWQVPLRFHQVVWVRRMGKLGSNTQLLRCAHSTWKLHRNSAKTNATFRFSITGKFNMLAQLPNNIV